MNAGSKSVRRFAANNGERIPVYNPTYPSQQPN
jgi:hypothetical protein